MKLTEALIACAAIAVCLPMGLHARADETRSIVHQGVVRTFHLHLPSASRTARLPLVIALHGTNQKNDVLRRWLPLDRIADREGFAVAYPESWRGLWAYGPGITTSSQPQVGGEVVDDIGFLRAVIGNLLKSGIADPKRVYVTGVSRGGFLTFTVACAMADVVAAVAPLIANMDSRQRSSCAPVRPLPIMVVAGTGDSRAPYDGWLEKHGRLLSVPEIMEFWRTLHGCTRQSFTRLPHRRGTTRSRIGVFTWLGCRSGATLRLYRVYGGGHQVPSLTPATPQERKSFGIKNADLETAEEIWAFFSRAAPK